MKLILDGTAVHDVETSRMTARVLERPSNDPRQTVMLVHGNVSSSLFFQPMMLALPLDIRALAIVLRGFGGSETLPVDATRGLRDFSEDVAVVLDELQPGPAHLLGWSLGAGLAVRIRGNVWSGWNPRQQRRRNGRGRGQSRFHRTTAGRR